MYIICSFLCILQTFLVQSSMAPTHLVVTRVGPCIDSPRAKITVSELGIVTQTYDLSLSGQLNISEDIENGWKIKVTMQKCQDIRNTDTCDYFKTFYLVKRGCEDEDDDEQEFYGMFFHYAHPRLECPVRAGVYTINGYPFFTEDNYLMVSESKISTSIFGYTYRLDGFTTKRQWIFCVEAYLQLLYIRDHNWSTNKTAEVESKPSPDSNEAIDQKNIHESDNKSNENGERDSKNSEEDIKSIEEKANDKDNEDDRNDSEE